MTGRLASGRSGLRVWVARWRTLGLGLPLLALATAAFALAPSGIGQQVGARPDLSALPSTQGASVAPPATHARSAVTRAAVSGGERTRFRPRRAGQRRVQR
ncbi:MAG TPA: hypothetical protein VEF89_05750 [Solirubrobacteraceae bacterium]|nr:hypothetical protein [Solirubrobacteraceae bacterium]